MADQTGIKMSRVDLSDHQRGKGAFDRTAASIKFQVRIHINEDHDITTAREFSEAVMFSGRIKGFRVALVDASSPTLTNSEVRVKWTSVSSQNNFLDSYGYITAWRAYEV